MYFFIFGALSFLEFNVLYPVKLLLNMICTCVWPILKALLSVWLYYDTYRGALLIEQIGQPHFNKIYQLAAPIAGKALSFVGVPVRSVEASEEKK